ncbi:MAG: hypothetical protein KAJ92_07015, partial [Gammaproteobacteria bacterium]|nr:hypothetical protein [Gammaproteobacteria bacterium]
MRASIQKFILCSTFFLHFLITHDVIAQNLAVEVGEKDINLVYGTTEVYGYTTPFRLDSQFLYSKQNNHQDLFASIGLTAFNSITNRIELGAGFRIIAADPLDYYLSAITIGAELAYRPATTPKFKFKSSLYYAGELLTFSDGNAISLLKVDMDYEVV